MNTYKWTFALLLALSATSAVAQVKTTPNTQLNNQVERAVVKATAGESDRDPQLLIQAETLWQLDRNRHGGYAKHNLDYYYNQLLEEQNVPSASADAPSTQPVEELSTRELIDAETELAFICNTWDSNGTFEKYPYLLDPEYRRTADEQVRQRIRDEYKTGKRKGTYQPQPVVTTPGATPQSSLRNPDSLWGRKVGL